MVALGHSSQDESLRQVNITWEQRLLAPWGTLPSSLTQDLLYTLLSFQREMERERKDTGPSTPGAGILAETPWAFTLLFHPQQVSPSPRCLSQTVNRDDITGAGTAVSPPGGD